jgi:hypothetical protein
MWTPLSATQVMPVCNDYITTQDNDDDNNGDNDVADIEPENPLLLKPTTSPRAFLNRLLRRVVLIAMQQDGAQQFLEAVDILLYPDYKKHVKECMDLGTMHKFTTEVSAIYINLLINQCIPMLNALITQICLL